MAGKREAGDLPPSFVRGGGGGGRPRSYIHRQARQDPPVIQRHRFKCADFDLVPRFIGAMLLVLSNVNLEVQLAR